MTGRDRIVIVALAALAVLAAVWLLAVAPEREKASKLATEVSSAQAQLASAESQVASASAAQAQYQNAYASIVSLGKAVPADQEVPSLIYQLAQATNEKNVEFTSITSGSSGSSAGSSVRSAAGLSAGASAAAGAGFTQMPFTFVFNGDFNNLYNLFEQIDGFAQRTSAGGLQVSGRLLTVQSVSLTPGTSSSSGKSNEELTGTITATAYVLPAGQTLTGGATSAGPAGTATQTASTGSSSSANSPAVVQVNP